MKKMLFSVIALVAFTATSVAGELPKNNVVSVMKAEVTEVVTKNVDDVLLHSCKYAMYSNGTFVGYVWIYDMPNNESCEANKQLAIDIYNS